jgi:hypothetical protein
VFTGIALVGAVVGAVAEKALELAYRHGSWLISAGTVVTLMAAALSAVGTVIFIVQSLLPRTPTAKGSLASFPDIAKTTQADYITDVSKLDSASIAGEYAAHTWLLSRIAVTKFGALRKALLSLAAATIAAVCLVGVHVWMAYVETGP